MANPNQPQRNIFIEALQARAMTTSISPREKISLRGDLVANEILCDPLYPRETVISRDLYDSDSLFRQCLNTLNPVFEFPNWEGRTVYAFRKNHGIGGEPDCLNVIGYRTKEFNRAGVHQGYITVQQMWDATELDDTGWLLPSGLEIWFHQNVQD